MRRLGVPGKFTLQNYVRAFADPEAYPLLLNSFIFGIGASGLSVVFALALAWITIRTNAPFRRLFELTAIIPNISPADSRLHLLGHAVESQQRPY